MSASPRRAPIRAAHALAAPVVAAHVLAVLALLAVPQSAAAAEADDTIQVSNSLGLPRTLGACAATHIVRIGSHPAPGGVPQRAAQRSGQPAGLAVGYANAGSQVSVVRLPEITRSRVDDPVRMCLVTSSHAYPGGIEAARAYRVTNERTRETWTLPDPDRPCAGR